MSALNSSTSQFQEPLSSSNRSRIRTALILNRAPILTTEPTPFEDAYYAYHARLSRALRNPFPSEFYFKKGSPLEATFNALERKREKEAFGSGFGTIAVGQEAVAKAEADALAISIDEEEKPLPRQHPSDTSKDLQSLDRLGPRNLYLLIRNKDAGTDWKFPQASNGVREGELLHQVSHTRNGSYMSLEKIQSECLKRNEDSSGRQYGYLDCQSAANRLFSPRCLCSFEMLRL